MKSQSILKFWSCLVWVHAWNPWTLKALASKECCARRKRTLRAGPWNFDSEMIHQLGNVENSQQRAFARRPFDIRFKAQRFPWSVQTELKHGHKTHVVPFLPSCFAKKTSALAPWPSLCARLMQTRDLDNPAICIEMLLGTAEFPTPIRRRESPLRDGLSWKTSCGCNSKRQDMLGTSTDTTSKND